MLQQLSSIKDYTVDDWCTSTEICDRISGRKKEQVEYIRRRSRREEEEGNVSRIALLVSGFAGSNRLRLFVWRSLLPHRHHAGGRRRRGAVRELSAEDAAAGSPLCGERTRAFSCTLVTRKAKLASASVLSSCLLRTGVSQQLLFYEALQWSEGVSCKNTVSGRLQ